MTSLLKNGSPLWKRSDWNTITGNMALNQDFKEFLESLNDNHVRYLIVGGYAVAFHGHPRYTKDIDVWVGTDRENAASIIKALDQLGFASLGLKKSDFIEPDQIVQLGFLPKRIDIITTTQVLSLRHAILPGLKL